MIRRVARGEHDRVRHGADAAVDQGDAGGGHRRAGAGGDRDADVGGGEGGRVVDAVADHSDWAAGGAQPLHQRGFVLREQFGVHDADPGGMRGGGGRLERVPGGQHWLQPQRAQLADTGRAVGTQRVGDSQQQP